jgi:hypothetical protein
MAAGTRRATALRTIQLIENTRQAFDKTAGLPQAKRKRKASTHTHTHTHT